MLQTAQKSTVRNYESETYNHPLNQNNIVYNPQGGGTQTQVTPVRIITRVIFLEKPTTLGDVIPFIAVFLVYGLIVQMVLSCWQRIHKKSHNIFQLIMVLIFPPLLMLHLSDYLFLSIWGILLIFILYCLKKVIFTSMNSDMPREVFLTFKHIFFYTNVFIISGQIALAFSFLVFTGMLAKSLRLLFYSLYIAVLSREVIFNLSHIMAAKTGYFSKEGIPGVKESASSCMICTGSLSSSSRVIVLNCNHSFHEDCIRGWCLIGQNKFCPYCKKGVDNTFFTQDLWEKTEMPFKPLMNFLRSFISFFIVVYCILMYKFRS